MRIIPDSGDGSINDGGDGGGAERALPKRFQFHGRRKTLAWMMVKYGLLTLLTFGIYRFWAKTHLRRYLWSVTEFDGDRFEWHGTAKELFIGFLIALAVLLPLTIGDNLLRVFVLTDEAGLAIYSLFYLVLVLFLINFAFYRMWRYRLTRTSWRSIRFNLTGSAAGYALRAMAWTALTGITAGLAYPWMQAALIRIRMNETEVGGTAIDCTLRGWDLFPRYVLCLLLGFLALSVPMFLLGASMAASAFVLAPGSAEEFASMAGAPAIGYAIALPVVIGLMLYYRVFAYRRMIQATTVGAVALNASIRVWPLIVSALVTGFLVILVLAIPFSGIILAFAGAGLTEGTGSEASGMVLAAIGFGMFASILVMPLTSAVSMAGFAFTAMKSFLEGTIVENPAELDQLVQNAGPAPSYGEGFADALDVGAF